MNNAYNTLVEDLVNEDEMIYTQGDDVLSSFYYGNWSQGIKEMLEYYIEPKDLAEYLEEMAEEYDCNVSELYNGHFSLSTIAQIGESYNQARIEA